MELRHWMSSWKTIRQEQNWNSKQMQSGSSHCVPSYEDPQVSSQLFLHWLLQGSACRCFDSWRLTSNNTKLSQQSCTAYPGIQKFPLICPRPSKGVGPATGLLAVLHLLHGKVAAFAKRHLSLFRKSTPIPPRPHCLRSQSKQEINHSLHPSLFCFPSLLGVCYKAENYGRSQNSLSFVGMCHEKGLEIH